MLLNKNIIKPEKLNRGDTVGIVAPASSFDINNFKQGIKMLRNMGYRVKYERSIFNKCWSRPGHDKQRAMQINRMFADKQVKAILCAKAGYGSIGIIPYLNKTVIRRNPKIFVGYSDITIILLYLQKIANMVVFHGPVISGEVYEGMNQITLDYFLRVFNQTTPVGPIMFPQLVSFKPGKAKGRLVGGNITLLAESVGTPYRVSTEGAILFLEDVDENLDSIRNYLLRLRHAGKFSKIAGVLFGRMVDCFDLQSGFGEVVRDIFKNFDIPILFGFPSGHLKRKGEPHVTLPLGIMVSIDAYNTSVQIDEAAVVDKIKDFYEEV